MARSNQRQVFRKSLRLESLERREVFAGDVEVWPLPLVSLPLSPPVAPPANEEVVLDWHINQKRFEFTPPFESLSTFETQTQFEARLKEMVGKYWQGILGETPIRPEPDINYMMLDSSNTYTIAITSAADRFQSITNSRHAEIDEGAQSDLTTDGFLYAFVGGAIQIVDLRDPTQVQAKLGIELPNSNAQIMVAGDQLIVIQTEYQMIGRPVIDTAQANWPTVIYYPPAPLASPQVRISLYDITDRKSPVLQSEFTVEGRNQSSNLKDGILTLVQANELQLPRPELVTDSDGVQRFQSLDVYFEAHRDRIVAALTPDYKAGEEVGESGDWQDLVLGSNSLTRSTSIVQLAIDADQLTLVDSEVVIGVSTNFVYRGLEDIYIVSFPTAIDNEDRTLIYKIDDSSNGQMSAVGVSSVTGNVASTTWLNENDGVLQVASQATRWQSMGVAERSANITTIGDTGSGWGELGSLLDFADGQSLLSVNFLGDRAVVTTGVTPDISPEFYDPLHGIDLSDPANPVEYSELTIPGFTTYLMQVDDSHWLGLGYEVSESNNATVLQVSLYDVADLANPSVVDRWTSNGTGWFNFIDPHSVHFDRDTGLLALSNNLWRGNTSTSVPLLKIDPAAEHPIQELGTAKLSEPMLKSFTMGDVYVALTRHSIFTFNSEDLTVPLGAAYLAVYDDLAHLRTHLTTGSTSQWDVKSEWLGEPFTILEAVADGQVTATLNADQTITLVSPESLVYIWSSLKLTVQFQSGRTETVNLAVSASPPEQRFADASAAIEARFTDEDGHEVTDLAAGDEVWVTVRMTEPRVFSGGFFAAYVDVHFDSGNITVIGQPEALNNFSNGTNNRGIDHTGIKSLGGFGGLTPTNSSSSDFARFKIRIDNDQPVTMTFTAAANELDQVLLFNESKAVDPARIASTVLTTSDVSNRQTTTTTAIENSQDLNTDGIVSALDVLLLVNHINGRDSSAIGFSASAEQSLNLDITGDGVVSALDVLQIVNAINARFGAPASGEGPSSSHLEASAVDQALLVDFETLPRVRRA